MKIKAESLQNYFSLLGNDPITHLLNSAQIDFLKRFTDREEHLLSAVSPSMSFPYCAHLDQMLDPQFIQNFLLPKLYPAHLAAIRVKGWNLKEWLEIAASIYQKPYDKKRWDKKPNLLHSDALTFLFYPISGLDFTIDIDKHALFNQFGEFVEHSDADEATLQGRISNIQFQGNPIKNSDEFVLIANRYCPFMNKWQKNGGEFIDIVPEDHREIYHDYLQKHQPTRICNNTFSHWYLTSGYTPGAFLSVPVQSVDIPEYLKKFYHIVPSPDNGSGYEIYFK